MQNDQQQLQGVLVKFEAPPEKNLLNLRIESDDVDKIRELPIHSIVIIVPMDACAKLGIMIPPQGLLNVKVKTDDEGIFGEFLAIDPTIIERPSDLGLEGLVDIRIFPSPEILGLWVSKGKKLEWEITRDEVDEFIEERKKEFHEMMEKQKKEPGKTEGNNNSNKIILP